jgi:geranylgeranyl reductase family protein
MKEKFDIAIIGAGPAGSTAALALGKSGLSVALIDKDSFPREKICGGAVAAYAPKVLNTIDPIYVQKYKEFQHRVEVNTCRIFAPNQQAIDVEFSESGIITTRHEFDNFLFSLASNLPNVTSFENTKVAEIMVKENEVIIGTSNGQTIESKLVIGCDGARSIVRRTFTNIKPNIKHHCIAARVYYKNVDDIPEKTFELHYLKDIDFGYFWIFPLPNKMANVGIGIHAKTIRGKGSNLKEKLQQTIRNNSTIGNRFKNAEMVGDIEVYDLPLGSRKVPISGNRFMLCGDAASLIDPATGEGIGHAMVSGRYAGWHAIKCFENQNFSSSFMKQYDRTVYRKLWRRNQKMFWIQKIIGKNHWLINIIVGVSARHKTVFRFFKRLLL